MINMTRRLAVVLLGLAIAACQVTPPAPQPKPPAQQPDRPIPPSMPPSTPSVPIEKRPTQDVPIVVPTTGGISHYQDMQEQFLRMRLDASGVRLQRNGDAIKIIIPANSAFTVNGDQLSPRAANMLNSIAPVLKEFAKTSIEIKGFTDSTGSFEHNQQLSQRRAQNVGSFLAARQISPARIRTVGFGPRLPIADNRTDTGRAMNRRIEIELVPAQ
jgi:outer membrane protein OmpA-like peptidoglycan-associated protein